MEKEIENLMEWCKYQNLRIKQNDEHFFINERVLVKPEFIINNRIFVDIADEFEVTEKYLQIRQDFSKSYGTIIILPKSVLANIMDISKIDIQLKFNIKF
jgi:hypothetical protein